MKLLFRLTRLHFTKVCVVVPCEQTPMVMRWCIFHAYRNAGISGDHMTVEATILVGRKKVVKKERTHKVTQKLAVCDHYNV